MAQPYPPGSEQDVPDSEGGSVKPAGQEMSRDWLDQHPGIPEDAIGTDPGPPPPPVAAFTYDPPDPGQTVTVTFDGSSSAPGSPEVPITAWDWLMDNNATRSGQVVTWRTPNGGGEHPVVLTVTAADLQTGQATQVLVIP